MFESSDLRSGEGGVDQRCSTRGSTTRTRLKRIRLLRSQDRSTVTAAMPVVRLNPRQFFKYGVLKSGCFAVWSSGTLLDERQRRVARLPRLVKRRILQYGIREITACDSAAQLGRSPASAGTTNGSFTRPSDHGPAQYCMID